jgi:hypothetical protein
MFLYRIESLFLVFCGAALLLIIMQPHTEILLGRIFPWPVKAFLMSLFEALPLSLMLFGVLGVFAEKGVHLIPQHPISFLVVSGIGTALFLWANTPVGMRSNALG